MTFDQMIDKIMPEVERGGEDPIMIYRDADGGWHGDFTRNQYGENFDWVEDVVERDKASFVARGLDFAGGSMPYVHDKILSQRLRNEYYNEWGYDQSAEHKKVYALLNFFEDNVAAFSSGVTDYLTGVERPLAALIEMCPFNMATDWPGWTFNEDLAADAVDHIENAAERLSRKVEPIQSNKRVIEGYEEKQSIQVAGQLVILAESPKADAPYMVCYCKWDNPLGINEYYNACVTDDYVEALNLYANGILSFTQILEKEKTDYEQPPIVLTAADCVPKGLEHNLAGSLIVIKPEVLAPEYRRSEHQIKHCTGGFGASPNSRGNAVFCKDLYSGKESRFERYDVAGIIDTGKMPEWAVKKLALTEALKEPGVFVYGGYHFKPVRQFKKGEIDRPLKGDSRPWKIDVQYAMRNMGELLQTSEGYTHEDFYAKSGDSDADIFKCVETGYLFVPCANGLFLYNEPSQKEKLTEKPAQQPQSKQLPSLLGEVREAAQFVEQRKAERGNTSVAKNREKTEI